MSVKERESDKDNNDNDNSNNNNKSLNTSTREELWNTRQQLYRLYDLESISVWRARDLLVMNELMEEYDLIAVLAKKQKQNREEEVLTDLHAIKDRINSSISEANASRDYGKKALLAKQLDKILTLIALTEADNREGINRIIATYHLLNRGDKQLLKALHKLVEELEGRRKEEGGKAKVEAEEEYRSTISKIREELEREIIELKKRL